MLDSKRYDIGGRQLRISVIESVRPQAALKQRLALQQAMLELKDMQRIDEVLLFIIDIVEENAIFLSASPTATDLVERAWKLTADADGTLVLPGVLSRKKQIIPVLEAAADGGCAKDAAA